MDRNRVVLRLLLISVALTIAHATLRANASFQGPSAREQPASQDPNQLKKENDDLKRQLGEYRKIEEDLVSQRIADKAEKQVLWWLGIGGLATVVIGLIGFRTVADFTTKLLKDEVERLMEKIGQPLIQEKTEEMVAQRVKELMAEKGEPLIRQQTEWLIQAQVKDFTLQEGQRQVTELVAQQKTELVAFAKQQYERLIVSMEPVGARQPKLSEAGTLARHVDYSPEMGPVRNQGQEGSVVGFAAAAVVEYQIRKKLGEQVTLSPRFIYYSAQVLDGTAGTDSGANIRSVLLVLKKTGAVPEEAWPYKAGELRETPPESIKEARHYKIKKSVRLSTLMEIKSGLEEFGPLLAGITVYSSMMNDTVSKTGEVPLPATSEGIMGGHAVCVVGYDDGRSVFKARNSWGENWGDHGYAYFPYAYAEQFFSETYALIL